MLYSNPTSWTTKTFCQLKHLPAGTWTQAPLNHHNQNETTFIETSDHWVNVQNKQKNDCWYHWWVFSFVLGTSWNQSFVLMSIVALSTNAKQTSFICRRLTILGPHIFTLSSAFSFTLLHTHALAHTLSLYHSQTLRLLSLHLTHFSFSLSLSLSLCTSLSHSLFQTPHFLKIAAKLVICDCWSVNKDRVHQKLHSDSLIGPLEDTSCQKIYKGFVSDFVSTKIHLCISSTRAWHSRIMDLTN